MKTCFTVTSSIEYDERLRVYLKSLSKTNPNDFVLCRLVNYDNREDLQKIFPNIEFILSTTNLSKKRDRLKGDQNWKYASLSSTRKCSFLVSDYECYCNNKRFENIVRAFDIGFENVINTDVDMIFNKTINCAKLLGDNDIVLLNENEDLLSESGIYLDRVRNMWYPGKWLDSKFKTDSPVCEESFIAIKNTPLVYDFFCEADRMLHNDFFNWDADYIILNNLYRKFSAILKISNLPVEYSDRWFFSENSYVWNGAAEVKHVNQSYIDRYNQILAEI